MFKSSFRSRLWKAIRDLQDENARLSNRIRVFEEIRDRRQRQQDWLLTKFVPSILAAVLAYAALATLYHW